MGSNFCFDHRDRAESELTADSDRRSPSLSTFVPIGGGREHENSPRQQNLSTNQSLANNDNSRRIEHEQNTQSARSQRHFERGDTAPSPHRKQSEKQSQRETVETVKKYRGQKG